MAKKKKEEPKFISLSGVVADDEVFRLYNKSVLDLEPGELFGMFFNTEHLAGIKPILVDTESGDKELKFDLAIYGINGTIYDEYCGVPLVLKKLDGNFVEDILTGLKFMIGEVIPANPEAEKPEYDMYKDLNSTVQKYVAEVGENIAFSVFNEAPIIAFSYISARVARAKYFNKPIVINDEFKAYYGKTILSKKDKVIKGLQELFESAHDRFNKESDKCLSQLHNVALTENFLGDKGYEYELKKEK